MKTNKNTLLREEIEQTPLHDWIDAQEVMQLLHISSRTLQTHRSNGTIPYSQIKGKIYYRKQDIQDLLADNYTLTKIKQDDGNTK